MSVPESVEDVLNAATIPKYEFHEQQLPRGSPAFQLIVTNADQEKSESDDESGSTGDKDKKERLTQYHGRRRNTIANVYGHDHPGFPSHLLNFRRGSMMPIPERASRSRTPELLKIEERARTRSLSPMTSPRRNSIQPRGVVFGSSKERETALK